MTTARMWVVGLLVAFGVFMGLATVGAGLEYSECKAASPFLAGVRLCDPHATRAVVFGVIGVISGVAALATWYASPHRLRKRSSDGRFGYSEDEFDRGPVLPPPPPSSPFQR